MTKPPPRKRFQFHLSTAIVLMFVAGGLIWANTITYLHKGREFELHGWPFPMWAHNVIKTDDMIMSEGLSLEGMASNVLTCLIIIMATDYISEWLIRGQATQK